MLKSSFYYYDEKLKQHMHRPINASDIGKHMYPIVRKWQEKCIQEELDK